MPKRYESVELRRFIWLPLHTDSVSEAEAKAGPAWEQLVAGWEAKLAGDTSDAEQRFESARELAEARGFRYMRVDKVAKLPTDELLARVDAVSVRNGKPDLKEAAALLGGAKDPCPSPLKLGDYISRGRGICNGEETTFRRRRIEAAAGD